MEDIVLYFLSLLLGICISFSLRFFTKRKSKLPPGSTGFPIIGETLHLKTSGPEKFIRQRMEKYSQEIFTTSLLGEKVAVVCGPAGNKFMLCSPNNCLVPWLPSPLTKFCAWIDPAGISAKEAYERNHHFVNQILRNGNHLKHYIPIMDSMTREHLSTDWDPFEEIKVHPRAKSFTLSLGCRLLLGLEDPTQIQKFSDTFTRTISAIFSMPINLPGTTYSRSSKEIENLKKDLLAIIEERKCSLSSTLLEDKSKGDNLDILSRMLMDQNANKMAELEIAFGLIGVLLPSHESASAAITFVLKYVAELPHICEMVYKEITEIAKSKAPDQELLNLEDIQKMEYCWNVISESLRLTPPAIGSFREVMTDLNFAGFTIPKGWKMLWSPFTTNKDPKYFPDPETFDPTRHEGNGPELGTHQPFSIGPRRCPGQEYSKFVILVYMYNVLRKFKLQNLIQDEKIVYHLSPVPANGLPMSLQPRTE